MTEQKLSREQRDRAENILEAIVDEPEYWARKIVLLEAELARLQELVDGQRTALIDTAGGQRIRVVAQDLWDNLKDAEALVEKQRAALEAIAREDELVAANDAAFAIHALRRCQESARAALEQEQQDE